MEMQVSAVPSSVTRLAVEEAVASQVLEIIGGLTLEALQAPEEPGSEDAWSAEEGDDAVFYGEESQGQQVNTSGDSGAGERDGGTADEGEGDPGGVAPDGENMKTEEANCSVFPAEGGEEPQELLTPLNSDSQSDAADPAAQSTSPDQTSSSCGEPLHLHCTKPEAQIQSELNVSAGTDDLPAEEEEALGDTQTQKLQLHDVPNEENDLKLEVEAEPRARLQVPADRREPEQDHGVQVPVGFHQKSSPAHSTLPLPNKHSQQNSFDHLTVSKYSTVSYRKIRRGNTRQKIEKFEYMMMNL